MIKKGKAFNEIHHLMKEGDSIVVGVSGGADSVCLLCLLEEMAREWHLTLHVLHVHHGIRGQEADRDCEFVRQLAARKGLPFCLKKVSVPKEAEKRGMTEEEAGRFLRYEALEEYRENHGLDHIAVAHNRDDQAETVLFHLFRGSGPRGLAGIPAKRGYIIRPLLFAGREEIENYLADLGQTWCTDSTNRDNTYTRNCIRNKILPMAERDVNSCAARHISEAAEKMAKWRAYIEKQGEQLYRHIAVSGKDVVSLPVQKLDCEDEVIRMELYRRALSELAKGAKDIGQIHYGQIQRLKDTGSPGGRLSLPGHIVVERQYDKLVFTREAEEPEVWEGIRCEIPSCHVVEVPGQKFRLRFELVSREKLPEEIPQKDYTKWFDYDMIRSSLELRNPREGDYFAMDGSGRRKKLSRHYIDRKIPRSMRAGQLVLAEGSHVLWVFPERISAAYMVRENTQNVLVVTKEREPS